MSSAQRVKAKKLNWHKVREIRNLFSQGVSNSFIAEKYSISEREANKIRRWVTWKNDPDILYIENLLPVYEFNRSIV